MIYRDMARLEERLERESYVWSVLEVV